MHTDHNPFSHPKARTAPEFRRTVAAATKTSDDGAFGWRRSVIRGQEKVAEHYRILLETHNLSQSERDAILSRLAVIEAEIDVLTGQKTGELDAGSTATAVSRLR